MGTRLLPLVLLALLVAVHAQLWLGRGSLPRVQEMQRQIDAQKAANAQASQANERLASEVQDLKEGLDMVEEKARSELGMVKQDEVFYQVLDVPPGQGLPDAAAAVPAAPAAAQPKP